MLTEASPETIMLLSGSVEDNGDRRGWLLLGSSGWQLQVLVATQRERPTLATDKEKLQNWPCVGNILNFK